MATTADDPVFVDTNVLVYANARTSYRQRLFVEHDLGESSGSTVDVAPSWVSMD